MDNITTYKGESKSISVLVPTGYTGFTMNFTINDNNYFDGTNTLSLTGITITNNIAIVSISKEENDIVAGVYYFQCDITNESLKYVISQGSYTVLSSIS